MLYQRPQQTLAALHSQFARNADFSALQTQTNLEKFAIWRIDEPLDECSLSPPQPEVCRHVEVAHGISAKHLWDLGYGCGFHQRLQVLCGWGRLNLRGVLYRLTASQRMGFYATLGFYKTPLSHG